MRWFTSTMIFVVACSPPLNPAGEPLKGTTSGEAFEGVACSAVRPPTEPDLMAWDPGSRSNLNRLRHEGVVAVRYQAKGCNVELELLSNCIGTINTPASGYKFSPYSANEYKLAHNASELFAQLPVGAARLAANVKGNRALRTDYMMVGQYALPAGSTFKPSDLHGDCARATHVVSAIYVGAFSLGAGEVRAIEAGASLLGVAAGGRSTAGVEVLADEGDATACKASQNDGKENERCAVPLRINLLSLDVNPSPPPVTGSVAFQGPRAGPTSASTTTTGLTWEAEDGPAGDYSTAAAAARCSSLGGRWRLPTIEELTNWCRAQSKGGHLYPTFYWSSTDDPSEPAEKQLSVLCGGTGATPNASSKKYGKHHVRCVGP